MSDEVLEQAAKTLYERDGGRPEIWENIGDELRQAYRRRAAAANPKDVDTRVTSISVGKTSTLLAERRFYDNTFLRDDDGAVVLFVCDAAAVRGPSGREILRTERDVIEFPDEKAMVAAVLEGAWVEAPLDEDRHWEPDVFDLVPIWMNDEEGGT